MEHLAQLKSKTMFVILSAIILVFCYTNTLFAETPKAGGEIKVRIRTDITSTDPHKTTALINATVLGHVVEPLLAYSENMEIVPVAVEKWDVSDDHKTYTFYLFKGKKFHNGREMTADDVKFSINRMKDSKTCARSNLFEGVEDVEVVDKYKVKIHLTKADAGFPHALAYVAPIMAVLPKEEVEKEGGDIKHPVGTGPFRFVEWKPDRYIIVEKFEEYMGQTGPRDGMGGERIAYLDKITFVPITEESVSVMSIVNKEVDLMQGYPPKYMEKYESEYSKKGMVAQEVPGLIWVGAHFGVTQPVVDNLKFRQACAYAMNIEQLAKASFMGHAVVNPSAIAIGNRYHTQIFDNWYKQDLTKAKELLKASGYNGEEVVFDTTKKYDYFYKMAVAAQAQLQAVGINVKLNVIDWPVLLQKHLKGESQIHIMGAAPMPDPALAYAYLKRNKFMDIYPDAEDLRQKAMDTADFKTRQKIFEQLHQITYDQVPWVLSCNYNYINVFYDYVKNYQSLGTGVLRLWGVWLDK